MELSPHAKPLLQSKAVVAGLLADAQIDAEKQPEIAAAYHERFQDLMGMIGTADRPHDGRH